MGMGFAPTWLRQMSHLLHKTTLTTACKHLHNVITVVARSLQQRQYSNVQYTIYSTVVSVRTQCCTV